LLFTFCSATWCAVQFLHTRSRCRWPWVLGDGTQGAQLLAEGVACHPKELARLHLIALRVCEHPFQDHPIEGDDESLVDVRLVGLQNAIVPLTGGADNKPLALANEPTELTVYNLKVGAQGEKQPGMLQPLLDQEFGPMKALGRGAQEVFKA
jgi:hypothetical protein